MNSRLYEANKDNTNMIGVGSVCFDTATTVFVFDSNKPYLSHSFRRRFSVEWRLSAEEYIHDHANRPNVACPCVTVVKRNRDDG